VSPELPGIHGEPITPVPIAKKRVGMSVLGLGTPEVEHWIRAGKGDGERKCTDKGKGKGKSVGLWTRMRVRNRTLGRVALRILMTTNGT
jgi:protein NEDD1